MFTSLGRWCLCTACLLASLAKVHADDADETKVDPKVAAAKQAAADKYGRAETAYAIGMIFYHDQQMSKAQEALESALVLSDDRKFQVRCYEGLLAPYRLLPKTDKMTQAVEFILTHGENSAQASLTRNSYASYLHQRGKTDEAVKRYEQALKDDAKNFVALTVLIEIYSQTKENPKRAAELLQQVSKLEQSEEDQPVNVPLQAHLALQYAKSKQFQKAAELFESIAPEDEKMAAWHYKEAADAWLKCDEPDKARAAAIKSSSSKEEQRSELLAYFWNRNLGDILLTTGEHAAALKHYKTALTKTTIDGYLNETRAKIEEAKAAAKTAKKN